MIEQGRRITGYKKNKVITTNNTAIALNRVQKEMEKHGYSLVIYDSYRPQKSVDQFVSWSQNENDQSEKSKYYPDINKNLLFEKGFHFIYFISINFFFLGYIAKKSGHTRGFFYFNFFFFYNFFLLFFFFFYFSREHIRSHNN